MIRHLAAMLAATALTLALLAELPGFAQSTEPGVSKAPLFRLHVRRDLASPSDMGVEWKPAPKVDPRIINAIGEVRDALPSWSGLHHMVPVAANN